jgi:hypothetical protein
LSVVRQSIADLTQSSVLQRAASAGRGAADGSTGEAFRATRAVPVFTVPFDRIAGDDFISHAVQNGWAYAIVSDRPAGMLYVVQTDAGEIEFQSLTGAASAERFLTAAKVAETRFQASTERFEVRLLVLALIRVRALWLRSSKDHFIAMEDYQTGDTGAVDVDVAFIQKVLEAAAVRRASNEGFVQRSQEVR